jgi:general secretion pathway protein H
MRKLVIGMRSKPTKALLKQSGFTLIEILIVIVIVGITLTFALLSFGDFGGERRIIVAAEHFVNYVKLTQQQAILEAGTLGIKLQPTGYQVLRYSSDGLWNQMPDKSIYAYQSVPSNAKIEWKSTIKSNKSPNIVINASGDMSPFTVTFTKVNKQPIISVKGMHDGQLAIIKHDTSK